MVVVGPHKHVILDQICVGGMDHLCPTAETNVSTPPWISNPCHGDWFNIIVSLLSVYVVLLLVVYLRWMENSRVPTSGGFLSQCHSFWAILSIFLFLIHCAEIADAFLSTSSPSHVLIVSTSSMALLVLLLILQHYTEKTGQTALLLVSGFLLLMNGIGRTVRFATLTHAGIYIDRLRPLTSILAAVMYFTMSGVEFFSVRLKKELTAEDEVHFHAGAYRHDNVHLFSKATFYWMNSLLKSGYKSPIEVEDLGTLPVPHTSKQLHQRLDSVMSEFEAKPTTANVWRVFLTFLKPDFFIGGAFKLVGDLLGLVGPLGISVLVTYVVDRATGSAPEDAHDYASISQLWTNGWTMAFIVFFSSIAQSTFSQASTHLISVCSIHLKVALQSLIYKKSLRLRTSPGKSTHGAHAAERKLDEDNVDLGILVNLASNDSTSIMSFFWIGHYIWAIPVKMTVIMAFLYMKLGASAVVGAATTIVVLMPLQLLIGRKMSRNTLEILELTDERLQHLSILIEKIKLFKLLGWEHYYCDRILDVRRKELELLDKVSIFWAILTFFTHASSVLVSLVIFGVHYLFGGTPLTSDSVFSTLALINQLMVPLLIFPVIIPKIADAVVSCRRISEFFLLPEIATKKDVAQTSAAKDGGNETTLRTPYKTSAVMLSINEEDEIRLSQTLNEVHIEGCSVDDCPNHKKRERCHSDVESDRLISEPACPDVPLDETAPGNWILTIQNGVFSWNPESRDKNLMVNMLTIRTGEIVIVIGKVGSGKSSILLALLGEMPHISGILTYLRTASIAYCPQNPWLLNTTVRDNILFGLPFRPRRYAQVIDACSLKSDLDILPKKDLTEIGEKGINLSGGQKQRIAIARALYSRASVVILDDPLSSLDLTTAATIFEEGIKRLVRRCKRTVIMVTHNLQFLSECDLVIVMEDGQILAQGKPTDVRFTDCDLIKRWKEASNVSAGALKEHKAKERWQLIKSAARIRRSLRIKDPDRGLWFSTRDSFRQVCKDYSLSGQNRKLFDACSSEWSYISDDINLPADEFHRSEAVAGAASIWSRRSGKQRKRSGVGIGRASSFQDRHTKSSHVVRQYSSPLSADTNRLYRTQRKGRQEIFNQFLSAKSSTVGHCREMVAEKVPVGRVPSAESGVSDLFSEFSDENDMEFDAENFVSTEVEAREYGTMRRRVYVTYMTASGLIISIMYIVITLAWQVVRVNTDSWLGKCIEQPDTTQGVLDNLGMYGALSLTAVVLSFVSNGLGQWAGSRARRKLHDSMLLNIVRCPNKLFESTPAGRIFNRFSTDVEVLDKKLATSIQRLMQFLLLCCSSIVINAIITPWFIAITLPMILLYYIVHMFYRCSSRELQRIDSITRSPIFSHFTETLSGLTTIRAFGCEGKFLSAFYTKLDLNTNVFLMLNTTNRWLGIILDYMGGLIVLLAMTTALVAVRLYPESISPSLVGLAMNYTLLVPIYLNWIVKFFVDCEVYLGAVERIDQYANLPTEVYNPPHPAIDGKLKLGEINFESVTLSYDSRTEPALIGINLYIPHGQKIGICGRSGSGKSTLALSLFNMLEIHNGQIKIDGLDIRHIPLHVLRTSGSIIPQDTLLFNGTVRENLDPTGSSTDAQLWTAIEEAHLKDVIQSLYHGDLDAEINAGQSLSGGQKQLFSLARAILQRSSFLVMDEATSNLDKVSEQVLMSAAQKAFNARTQLIIAHRLSTILDCDRIIVLDRGKIVEDGSPSYLMNRSAGIFSAMVKSSEEGYLVP